jgi:hypothetical protein
MFNSIVSSLKIGIPIRKIARDLKIDRDTMRSVHKRITGGVITPPVIQRNFRVFYLTLNYSKNLAAKRQISYRYMVSIMLSTLFFPDPFAL